MSEEFDWIPLDVHEVAALMNGFPSTWWIAGGWAIDLHLARVTREHGDVDVVVLGDDQLLLRSHLPGWDLRVAHEGRLSDWDEPIGPLEGSLWARDTVDGPWRVEFLLAAHDGDEWVFRHDPTVRRPVGEVLMHTAEGIPYLRPELVLLNKSRRIRERDEVDLETVLPSVSAGARAWLRERLPREHPWRDRLS